MSPLLHRFAFLALFAAAALIGVAGHAARTGSAPPSSTSVAEGEASGDRQPDSSESAPVQAPRVTRVADRETGAGTAAMLAAANAMRSGREFYLYAMQHPEAGGVFYAKRLLLFCSSVHTDDDRGADDTGNAPRDADGGFWQLRERASTQLRQKCADFTADELDDEDHAAGAPPRDRLERTVADVRSARVAGDAAAQKAALSQAVELGDAQVLDDLRIRLSMAGAGDPGTVFFEGAGYPITSDILNTAYFLLPCDLGLDCTIDADGALATQCNASGVCYADRFAYARGVLGAAPERYAQAVALASAMALAVRQGRVRAFMAPGS